MPIYDYACTACGEVTEVRHGIHDPAPVFCPRCGTEGSLRKAFAPPAVHFKGSGWAKKDRASSITKAAAKADSGSRAKPGEGASAETPATGGSKGASSDAAGSPSSSGSGAAAGTGTGAAGGD